MLPRLRLNGTKVFLPKCLLLTIKSALIPLQGFFIPYLILNAAAIPGTALSVEVVLFKGLLLTAKRALIPLQGFAVLSFVPKFSEGVCVGCAGSWICLGGPG